MPSRSPRDIPAMRKKIWKKGQSGNPKGRVARRTLESFVMELLDETIGHGRDRHPRMRALAAVIVDEVLNKRNDKVIKPILDRLWPSSMHLDVDAAHAGVVATAPAEKISPEAFEAILKRVAETEL